MISVLYRFFISYNMYALLFEAALGIDAEPLLKMQTDYDIHVAKSDKNFLERLANIRKLAAAL